MNFKTIGLNIFVGSSNKYEIYNISLIHTIIHITISSSFIQSYALQTINIKTFLPINLHFNLGFVFKINIEVGLCLITENNWVH